MRYSSIVALVFFLYTAATSGSPAWGAAGCPAVLVQQDTQKGLSRIPLADLDGFDQQPLHYSPGCAIGTEKYRSLGNQVEGPLLRTSSEEFDPATQVPVFPEEPALCLKRWPKYSIVALKAELLTSERRGRLQGLRFPLDQYVSAGLFIIPSTLLPALGAQEFCNLIQWVQPFQPGLKFDRELSALGADLASEDLRILGTQDLNSVSIEQFAEKMSQPSMPLVVRLKRQTQDAINPVLASLAGLARQDGILRIERVGSITLRNSTTSWVIQSGKRNEPGARKLFDKGLLGEKQIIGMIDDGIDVRHCFFAGLRGPKKDEHKVTYACAGPGYPEADLHGTAVAGIVAGEDPESSWTGDRGQAPHARIVFSPVDQLVGSNSQPVDKILKCQANQGAHIFTNSWGNDQMCLVPCREHPHQKCLSASCPYNEVTRLLDSFLVNHEDDIIIFAVSNRERVTTPENARNVLAVGASLQGVPDGGSVLPLPQAGISEPVASSGLPTSGPTGDNLRKPDLLAPGCRIRTSIAHTGCKVDQVAGREVRYYNAGDEAPVECASSWAAPAVAGAAALVREYFQEGWFPTGNLVPGNACKPTGALMRAMLLNATTNVKEVPKVDNYPSDEEGWGRLILDQADGGAGSIFFADDSHNRRTIVVDLRNQWGLTLGDVRSILVEAEDLKATLVWTDAYSWVAGFSPGINDLDLAVAEKKEIYCGNHFYNGYSKPEAWCAHGVKDSINNVEQVVISQKARRPFEIFVRAAGVTGLLPLANPTQGYALVVSGKGLTLKSPPRAVSGSCSNAMSVSPNKHPWQPPS